MLSKRSLPSFKSNITLFKGQSSRSVRVRKTISSRSTGRLSRVDFGPKPVQASKKYPLPFIPACFRKDTATYPRGYQLSKARARATRIEQVLSPAPVPPPTPQSSDPFGSPNIYRALGLRGGDSKFACACFRPAERTDSWGLADHIRKHEAEVAGLPFQWPPVNQEALPPVPFQSLCEYCRATVDGTYQETEIIIEDEIMTDAEEEVWDVDMYDVVIDTEMEDAPPLSAFSDQSFLRYTDHSVNKSGPPTPSNVVPWYTPRLQGTLFSQSRPSLPQVPKMGQFVTLGGRPTDPWGKYGLPEHAPQQIQDMKSLSSSKFAPAEKKPSAGTFELVYYDEDSEDDLSGDEGLDLTTPGILGFLKDRGD